MTVEVRPVASGDREAWAELYRGYASFYSLPVPDLDVLWGWIGSGQMTCLVATVDGEVVGMAHLREFLRPVHAGVGGFLDDLYVDESARGRGVGRALIAAASDLARERGWIVLRWLTSDWNTSAQALYDKVARRTEFVTFDLDPQA
ncbi:GNAT family N-acetyltransferase [Nocardioides sp.]|uniref:GNAT family N-acetyltransferase n=1 Tax=Nocardioides sp. TaxID=35761 RepID=UPI002C6DD4E0|nr:GNAT family N-acetyltransferase [Nocardioides sp.]HSX67713.1 GNAT family N-acetyltransferase [Nocardioides sp.]